MWAYPPNTAARTDQGRKPVADSITYGPAKQAAEDLGFGVAREFIPGMDVATFRPVTK